MSEERKWTPGPWQVVEGSESGHCCFDYSVTSPLKGGCNVVAEVFCGFAPDAHLIAAAPEIYEALVAVLDAVCYIRGIDIDFYARDEIKVARKALAKARGEK